MEDFNVEEAPLVKLLNNVLTEYTTTLRSLLSQFDTDGNRNTGETATQSRSETTERLIQLDMHLQRLYKEVAQHQQRQAEIRRIQLLSIASNKAKLEFINGMLDSKSQLEAEAADTSKRLEKARIARMADPQVEEIIEYAKKLSKFTAAPPNYDPANSTVPPEPPYPVLVAMRAGVLNRYRTKKTARDMAEEAGNEDGESVHHAEEDHFDEVDADDLLLSLDLNPDLE
ncbi:hypothetical protein H4R24_003366 [Coemansia sp. RSA 988]|nr:hypothetical protein H4R24_003366 [Coemansia sp. RSA 988]